MLSILAWTILLGGAASPVDFETAIAPILEQNCVGCHNEKHRKGGLSPQSRSSAFEGGESGPAIVSGKPTESPLLEWISGDDPEMPKGGPPLLGAEVAAISGWIEQGAAWPENRTLVDRRFDNPRWWSLHPLGEVSPPAIEDEWIRTPVDRFLLAKMREEGLAPAPEADRRTLLRRVTFDLHGLPPTPEEIDAFVQDPAPDAYERVVDRLLASPRYGERWARYWLDIVHYGDTHGYDKDKVRPNAWPYRDYVIASFNDDKPYARFLQEQIAGDVRWPDSPDAVRATGFIAAGPWDFVGHVELRDGTRDKRITQLLDRDDMLVNVLTTACSLTIQCARCHDHPFDPIRQEEYYSLQAIFAGVDRGDRPLPDPQRSERIAGQLQALRSASEALARVAAERMAARAASDLPVSAERAKLEAEWRSLTVEPGDSSPTNGYHSEIAAAPYATKWVAIDLGSVQPIDCVRLVPARPTDFPDTPGFGLPPRFRVEVAEDGEFKKSTVVHEQRTPTAAPRSPEAADPLVLAIDPPISARYVRITAMELWERTNDFVFALAELEVHSKGTNLARGATVTSLDSIEAGRWSRNGLVDGFDSRHALPVLDPKRADLERRLALTRIAEDKALDAAHPAWQSDADKAWDQWISARDEYRQEQTPTSLYGLVRLAKPRTVHLLDRGDVDQMKDLATPAGLRCVRSVDAKLAYSPDDEGSARAALADWITHREHPLTWRSIVNRAWQFRFGRGIVDTPSDFGRMGSKPSHPELLDWLARNFRDNGQSIKELDRLLVTSQAYRQSSTADEAARKKDPENRWLARMTRRRLDAESLRDALLACSGDLDLTMGGPGYKLFAFEDDHSPRYLYEKHDPNAPGSQRRSIYRFVVRSVPDPLFECLDAADPSQWVPTRNETLTALQALAFLNNRLILRQSERLAHRLEQVSNRPEDQVADAVRAILGRNVDGEEAEALLEYRKQFGLANTIRLLFNTNEFVFVD